MSFLTRRGEGPSFRYAGQPIHVLAGQDGQPEGFAAMELLIPAHFAGPIPHAHDEFDEAIYVLRGQLQVTGDQTLEVGAALSPGTPPDPDQMRELYLRHASRLLP
jgi:hypothetical protein